MFTIIPEGQTTILKQLGNLGMCAAPLLQSIVPDAQLAPAADRPFVQLAHSELANEDADRVFGYAGILKANAPVGIPTLIEPQFLGASYLIFSLELFEEHLRTVAGETIAELERAGGFEAFLDSEEVTAVEYLVAGLMECTKWCREHQAALTIRW
jgi:hypothetical protein